MEAESADTTENAEILELEDGEVVDDEVSRVLLIFKLVEEVKCPAKTFPSC